MRVYKPQAAGYTSQSQPSYNSPTMKTALVFLSLVALSQAGVPMLRSLEGKIINGDDAKEGERPYQVSLQTLYNFHFCGGSVLNKNHVITAAHCVQGKSAKDIKVIAGTLHLDYPQATHLATKIIVHADYNSYNSWINDIALIKVGEDFQVSETLSYVPLPAPSQEVPADSIAVVSGWGRLWEGGLSPKKLQRADILIADQSYCSDMYSSMGYTIHDTHICAHDTEEETGSCHGDSGGPLTVDGILVGLVSWANGCASRKYPTVYTRVPEYIDWINAHAV